VVVVALAAWLAAPTPGRAGARGGGAQKGNTNLIDLVQIGLNVPGKVTPGKRFRVMDELESQGEAASLQTVTYFYLSQDDVLDEKDVRVGGRRVPPMPPGSSHREVTAVTLNPATPSGDYYVIAMCDATKLMDERYENNNTRAVKIRVLAPPSQ
jgi:hypothetical protein